MRNKKHSKTIPGGSQDPVKPLTELRKESIKLQEEIQSLREKEASFDQLIETQVTEFGEKKKIAECNIKRFTEKREQLKKERTELKKEIFELGLSCEQIQNNILNIKKETEETTNKINFKRKEMGMSEEFTTPAASSAGVRLATHSICLEHPMPKARKTIPSHKELSQQLAELQQKTVSLTEEVNILSKKRDELKLNKEQLDNNFLQHNKNMQQTQLALKQTEKEYMVKERELTKSIGGFKKRKAELEIGIAKKKKSIQGKEDEIKKINKAIGNTTQFGSDQTTHEPSEEPILQHLWRVSSLNRVTSTCTKESQSNLTQHLKK